MITESKLISLHLFMENKNRNGNVHMDSSVQRNMYQLSKGLFSWKVMQTILYILLRLRYSNSPHSSQAQESQTSWVPESWLRGCRMGLLSQVLQRRHSGLHYSGWKPYRWHIRPTWTLPGLFHIWLDAERVDRGGGAHFFVCILRIVGAGGGGHKLLGILHLDMKAGRGAFVFTCKRWNNGGMIQSIPWNMEINLPFLLNH